MEPDGVEPDERVQSKSSERILVHPEHNPLSNEHHTKHIKQINKKIKNAFYLRVNVFSTKELIGNTLAFYFFYLFFEGRRASRSHCKGSTFICRLF